MRLNRLRLLVAAGTVAATGAVVHAGTALAAGSAGITLAHIAVSANCNNPDFPLCAPFPQGVGTGGIWFSVSVEAGGGGTFSGAECQHTVGGVGGPGGAGAQPINGTVTWSYTTLESAPAGAIFLGTMDPNDQYYLLTVEDEQWLIPTTVDHYSVRLASGVQFQVTVAP